ncbi:synemin-like [Megalops cyprinoides]|uniref:synemin-like n=1 Tax=Megalops cyprinoides TaxID=118141 RepID=UPI0018646BE4|nr:synemin-like [Megalops cyprinoides]
MLQFKRTFENEKLQLQELNKRLSQYLSRVKQLEQENAFLITEINTIRQQKSVEWENQYMPELRELRRVVDQLAFEKSKAEMERERLRREFQTLQALCCQESGLCKNIDGERRGFEVQLQQAVKKNAALEEHLAQLDNEYKFLEDAHRKEITHLRKEVRSRALPIAVPPTFQGAPTITMEDIEEYALVLSETWTENFEVYRRRVEELEESIKSDKATLDDLQREKMQHASELKKLHAEAEKQNKLQLHLEEQLVNMQETCRQEIDQYVAIIGELEEERKMLANTIAEKLKEHQQLLQVKMGLSLEVAAYRALLEGERRDSSVWTDQYAREPYRRIDIKMPSKPWTVTPRQEGWTQYPSGTGPEVRYMDLASSLKASFETSHFRPIGPTRVVPISIHGREQQRSPAKQDIPSFTKAPQAATNIQKKTQEETSVRMKETSQKPARGLTGQRQPVLANRSSPASSPTAKVSSPGMSTTSANTEQVAKQNVRGIKAGNLDVKKVTVKQWTTPEREEETSKVSEKSEVKVMKEDLREADTADTGETLPSKGKILESIVMEEIIKKVMRPAGLDTKISSSPDSKVTYQVEKMEGEDGKTKTQIILESKVEEDLDVSDDSVLEELLNKGAKKISLEDVKGTPTGSMIENLLTLGLQDGTDLGNKSVNVEIIEETVEGHVEEPSEVKPEPKFFQPSSMFFQIEELESDSHATRLPQSQAETRKEFVSGDTEYRRDGSAWIREGSKGVDSPYFSQAQETDYFVSTPDDSVSEPEEEHGISSYGNYGVVDDLSDERYYQEEPHITQRFEEDSGFRGVPKTTYMMSDHSFTKDRFPECIIEEEIHVTPTVQESMLEILKEDSMDPKKQLRGALEKLQGNVSESLKEELALLSMNDQEGSDNVSVDIKKVQQVSDNGTVTLMAELNVSQTLEDPSLLKGEGLSSSHPSVQQSSTSGASGGCAAEVFRDWGTEVQGMPSTSRSEKVIKLSPTEKSFTFQMDVGNVTSPASGGRAQEFPGFFTPGQRSVGASEGEAREGVYSYMRKTVVSDDQGDVFTYGQGSTGEARDWEGFATQQAEFGQVLQSQIVDPKLKISQEKKIATVYLESTKHN